MYYLLHYLDLGNQKSGSGVPTMNRNHLHPLKIKAYTDLETQQKISQVLTTLDRKIALNQQINAELEKMAKTLYDYWFVQFDFPDENGNPYKSSGGEMVYHPELKREVPKGWGRKTIGDYCKSTGGYAFKSSEWVESGNPVIKIKNIQEDGSLNISDIDFVDLSNKTIDEKFKVNVGDIVIAMTGATIGKFALIPKTDSDLYVNQRVGVFKLSAVEKLPFLINTLSQDYFRKSIIELSGGAAQPNISNEQINNIELIYPVENIIANFNEKLTASYKQIIQKRYETQKLTQLRDFLLPMLMNGQVEVV
ncbi:restriction endonuclease subunit S [Actinobacillus suis]|nr:restriction endonuclease subunit S [Actinobacillus suis]